MFGRVGLGLMPSTLHLAFTQQCIRSLETLGDDAMPSQNYAEAVAHYSMALSLSPVTRGNILIKRSKAYAAARIWEDALKDADEVCLRQFPLRRSMLSDVFVQAINLDPVSPLGYERKHEALQGLGRRDEANRTFNDMLSILQRSPNSRTQREFAFLTRRGQRTNMLW